MAEVLWPLVITTGVEILAGTRFVVRLLGMGIEASSVRTRMPLQRDRLAPRCLCTGFVTV